MLLFPRSANHSLKRICGISNRTISTSISSLSHDSNHPVRSEKIENRRRKLMLSRILRVDHAGEVGADRIYAGQMAVLGKSEYGPVIQVFIHYLNLFLGFFSHGHGCRRRKCVKQTRRCKSKISIIELIEVNRN